MPLSFEFDAPRPGDIGHVTQRHGELYAAEFGWGTRFEGLVAGVLGEFAVRADQERERGWIARADGKFAGSVFLMRDSDEVARLRCLLVEPFARGEGLGGKLVDLCIDFAREREYRRLTLWTNKGLASARRIYEARDFRLTQEAPHDLFGSGNIGQDWDLDL